MSDSEDDTPVPPQKRGRGRPRRVQSSDDEQTPRPRPLMRKTKTAMLGARWFKCCQTKEIPHRTDTLTCVGQTHANPHLYHASCVETQKLPGRSWLCPNCEAAQRNAAAPEDSQTSQSSRRSGETSASGGSQRQWAVRAIKDKRVVPGATPDVDVIEYRVQWEPTNARVWEDTWETPNMIDDGPLIQKFNETGEAAFETDGEDEEDEELAQAVAHQPADFQATGLESSNPYWPHLQDGYWYVLRAMFVDVQKHKAASNIEDFETFGRIGLEMLASIPIVVLRAICGPGLVRSKYTDPDLRSVLRSNKAHSRGRPCIYVIELTDDAGNAATKRDMLLFVTYARRYLSTEPTEDDNRTVLQIEKKLRHVSAYDRQLILDGDLKQRTLLTDSNRLAIRKLLDKIDQQVEPLHESDKVPFVLRDVGYTDDGELREKQHIKHQASNKIMALFDLISVAMPKLDGKLRLKYDVVFLCFRAKHAPLGEIIFSLLAQSYVETGRGFNGVPAGIQQRSIKKYGQQDVWEEWHAEAIDDSPFMANIDAEADRITAARREIDSIASEIDRLNVAQLKDELVRLQNHAALDEELDHQNQVLRELDL